MTLNLYSTSSEPNRIGKSLTLKVTKTGTLRSSDDGNVINPVIAVGNASTVMESNYAYITEYNRYYFITNKRPINNGLVELSLSVDVLESFKTQIKSNTVLIERSEINSNAYLNDNERPVFNYPMVLTKSFSTGFDSFKYYLATASKYS